MSVFEYQRGIHDPMIGRIGEEGGTEPLVHAMPQHDANPPQIRPQRGPVVRKQVAGQRIERAGELAGLEVQVAVPLLELVQLLQHRDGNHHVVVAERENALGIVQDHVGVEHKQLPDGRLGGRHGDSIHVECAIRINVRPRPPGRQDAFFVPASTRPCRRPCGRREVPWE